MKILHLTGEYPPYVLGGLGTYVSELAERQARKSHQIQVGVIQGEKKEYFFEPRETNKNIQVKILTYTKSIFENLANSELAASAVFSEFDLSDLIEFNPDIIHVHDWYGSLLSVALKIRLSKPLIFTSHLPIRAGFTYAGHQLSFGLKSQLEALAVRMADKVLAPSDFVKATLISEYNANKNKIEVVANGVDAAHFLNKSSTSKSNSDENKSNLRILSVSRLTEQKGLLYLVDVVLKLKAMIPNISCTIVGEGSLKNKLIDEIKDKGLEGQIKVVGFKTKSELLTYYHNADVFVSTSIYEPFGLVLLEAMACGLPIVAFDVGGVGQVVTQEVLGMLVNPGNTEAMAQGVVKFGQVSQSDKLINQQIAANFDWQIIANKINTIYMNCSN